MITQIKLRHWKSHELTEVNFSKGTNLLVGTMGSGKTSVLEGICFALFGTFPALKSKRVKLAEVMMARPQKYSDASVELWFEVDGVSYSVERLVKEGESAAYLRAGGRMLESGSERVNETIAKILRMDYDLFSRAVYSEQNRIDYFLTLGKGERKKQVDSLLGIDRLEAARSNAGTLANKLRALKSNEEAFLSGIDAANIETELESKKQALEQLNVEIQAIEKTIEENTKAVDKKTLQITELEAIAKKLAELTVKEGALKSAIEANELNASALEKQLGSSIDFTTLDIQKTACEKEISSLENARRMLEETRLKNQNARGQLQATRQRLEAIGEINAVEVTGQHAQAAAQASKLRESIKENVSQTSALKTKAVELEKRIAKAKESKNKVTEIQGALELEKRNYAANGIVEELEKQFTEIEARMAAAVAKAKEIETALTALDSTGATCPVCDAPLDENHRKHSFQQKSVLLGQLKEQLQTNAIEAKTIQEKLRQAKAIKERIFELESKSNAIKESIEDENTLEKELQAVVTNAEKLASGGAGLETNLKEAEKQIAELDARVQQAKEKTIAVEQAANLAKLVEEYGFAEEKLSQSFSEEKLTGARNRLNQLDKAAQAKTIRERASVEKNELTGVQNELSKLSFDEKQLTENRVELSKIQQERAAAKADLDNKTKNRLEATRLLGELEKKATTAREKLAKVKSLENKIIGVGKFQAAVVETQSAMRNELVSGINEAMGGLWTTIYPYRDYPAARLNATEDDYELELQTLDGNWIGVDSASGGERACAALSLRTAFAVTLAPSLSWLFLDEPTHNLDSTAVTMLSRALRDEIPKIVEQTFIITHDEALREAASAKIYRVERDKDEGDKSTIEEINA